MQQALYGHRNLGKRLQQPLPLSHGGSLLMNSISLDRYHVFSLGVLVLGIFALFGGVGLVSAETSGSTILVVDRADDAILCVGCQQTCTGENSADCTLRAAMSKANSLGAPTEITFADVYTIELTKGSLPTMSTEDIDIASGPAGKITIDGNGACSGFTIENELSSLDNMEMRGFTSTFVSIEDNAKYARVSNMLLQGECSQTLTGSTVGILVTGQDEGTKATIWRNTICGMGDAAIRTDK